MPLPITTSYSPHMRVSWGGTLGTPPLEIFSNTVNVTFESAYVPTASDLQLICDAVAPAVSSWFSNAATFIHSDAFLDYVKCNWVQVNGRQRDPNTIQHTFSPMPIGNNTGPPPPWEITYALTMRTALRRGRGHSGRIFPPLIAVAINDNGPYISEADATSMGTSFATLLDAIRDACLTAPVVKPVAPAISVISVGDTTKSTTPSFQHVTGVTVDRVADIQHRRTNRVPRAEVPAVALTPIAG